MRPTMGHGLLAVAVLALCGWLILGRTAPAPAAEPVTATSLSVASLNADIGDRVKKGQVLATLADASVQADENKQQASVAQAAAQLQEARSNARRAAVVGQSGALSEQQLEEYRVKVQTAEANLASANADLRSTRIRLAQTRIVAVDHCSGTWSPPVANCSG